MGTAKPSGKGGGIGAPLVYVVGFVIAIAGSFGGSGIVCPGTGGS